MFDNLIIGGKIVDGSGQPWFRGDVGIIGDRIAAIGRLNQAEAKVRVDASGMVVSPGFIDAHVHGDLMLLADPLHEPAIRQGVTTYIIGQDGESMAPASPTTLDYMRQYTAGFNGNPKLPPSDYTWKTIPEYLNRFDHHCALNVAYLIPNGNVRMEVMGLETRPPNKDELQAMRRMVREGMEQGAVGLSSGLDYIPSRYADTAELTALCEEMSSFGGVYVTHMRRYDPEGIEESMEEVFRIGREADVAVHISHFNCKADLGLPLLDAARKQGIDATYDLYCYLAGSTILGMIALPAWVQEGGIDTTVERLNGKGNRKRLADWFVTPRIPLEEVRLTHIAAASFRQYEGRTLEQAAQADGRSMGEFVCDMLIASEMVVGCIVPHQRRGEEDVQALIRHEGMMAGSDGIYIGSRPHPRGWGCFARYLGHYVRDAKVWTLEEAVSKLSHHTARRFGLKDRGLLREGMAADVVVLDAEKIRDQSTYEDGRRMAEGMEHVIVNGEWVLQHGKRTAALPGRALSRKTLRA